MTVTRQREINQKAYVEMRKDPERLAKHRKRQADYRRIRRQTDPEYKKRTQSHIHAWMASAKENCINMYSNGDACCAWCPQADIDVLCLDHIDETKTKEFTKLYGHRGGRFLFAKLRTLGYPPGFQVLCANCNLKKEILRRRKERIARGH
jgi:hypothetical protein